MNVSNEVIIFVLVFIPIVFLYIVNRMSHSKSDEKILKYKEKIVSLNENIKQLQDSKVSSVKETSYIQHELKKQEQLTSVIEKQKKKINDLSAIAKEAMKTKYDFLSNMRHEVRTPLNSILVFSELLKNSLDDEKQKEYAKNILTSGNNLLVFVDKIIELGEVESGHFKRKDTAIDVKTFINDLTSEYKAKANAKGLLFTIEIDPRVPASLILDKNKVRDILANFLDNALKFTKYGSIKIDLKLKSIDKLKNSVNISFIVKDSGKGIDSKHQKTIFNIFEKKDDGDVDEYQSKGLGLSINKKIAKQLDGDIVLASQVDIGSTFSLYLNNVEIVLSNSSEKIDEDSIDFSLIKPSGATIAIIDSQMRNIKQVRDSFEGTTTKVLEFIDTREALSMLKTQKIDLLYIDAEILSIDDGAVSKVIKTLTNAPTITLIEGRVKDIEFNKKGIIPISHIKKPISKLELFKSSLMVLNAQTIIVENNNVFIDDEHSLNKDIDTKKLEHFLQVQKAKIHTLHNVASSSNDLNAIKVFASTLLKLSKVYEIETMIRYSKLLLKKIELFDIETINFLMKEYKNKLEELENIGQ